MNDSQNTTSNTTILDELVLARHACLDCPEITDPVGFARNPSLSSALSNIIERFVIQILQAVAFTLRRKLPGFTSVSKQRIFFF